MSNPVKHCVLKILVVVSFTAALVGFGLVYNNPEQGEAAQTQEFGDPTCDEFIPIGTALDGVLGMLDQAFEVYNGEKMDLAMDNMAGILSGLTGRPNVCDFTKCLAQVDNQGPQIGAKLNAFFWKGGLLFKIPPWCVPQEGIGEPCPDISQYLEDNDKNIAGLRTLKDSFMASAEMLHDIFEKDSERLSADLVKPTEGIGTKITKAELYLRLIEKTENQLTPGTYNTCALSELERKLVADGRLGDKYPLQCEAAREQGLYWPRQWSEGCRKQCEKSGNERECIECLANEPGDNASQLAKINYKIYGECKNECSREGSSGSGEREWELTKDCENCLCKVPVKPVAGSGGITGGATAQLSEEECLDWLCGGSSSNWVCCHERPLEEVSERPDIITPPTPSPTPPAPTPAPGAPGPSPGPAPGPGAPGLPGACPIASVEESMNCELKAAGDKKFDYNCAFSEFNRWSDDIDKAVNQTGRICDGLGTEDTKRFIKAIISQESGGNINQPLIAVGDRAAGLVQIKPSIAKQFKDECGLAAGVDITPDWLKKEENAQAQICMAIEYLKTLAPDNDCGCNIRHLAGGYNGGHEACEKSVSCKCTMCSDEPYTRKWECLWDDDGQCNKGFKETRVYVPKVQYCYEYF